MILYRCFIPQFSWRQHIQRKLQIEHKVIKLPSTEISITNDQNSYLKPRNKKYAFTVKFNIIIYNYITIGIYLSISYATIRITIIVYVCVCA